MIDFFIQAHEIEVLQIRVRSLTEEPKFCHSALSPFREDNHGSDLQIFHVDCFHPFKICNSFLSAEPYIATKSASISPSCMFVKTAEYTKSWRYTLEYHVRFNRLTFYPCSFAKVPHHKFIPVSEFQDQLSKMICVSVFEIAAIEN